MSPEEVECDETRILAAERARPQALYSGPQDRRILSCFGLVEILQVQFRTLR